MAAAGFEGGSSVSSSEAGGRHDAGRASSKLQASSVQAPTRPQMAAQPPSSSRSSSTLLGSGTSGGSGSGSGAPSRCRVRHAEASDYWAIADLHCMAFYPRATFFWFSALRLDRVMALQLGES